MFLHLLTLLFIGLKLTGQIDWNWFWVLSPTISVFVLLLASLIVLAIYGVGHGSVTISKRKEK